MINRILMACGLKKDPKGRPPFIWAERINGPLAGLILAVGVPLLSISGYSNETKWVISSWWFVSFSLFIYLESRELFGQMYGRGFLDANQVSWQKFTLVVPPMLGAFIAFVVWLAPEQLGLRHIGIEEIHYGTVEWNILGASVFVFAMFYIMIDRLATYLGSVPRRASAEQQVP